MPGVHPVRSPLVIFHHTEQFSRFMLQLLTRINDIVRRSCSWIWILKYKSLQDQIARTRKQIDDLRSTFTVRRHPFSYLNSTKQKTSQLMTIIDLHLRTHKNIPNEISVWGNLKPVRLIDAMNMTIDLPIEFCMTRAVRLLLDYQLNSDE